MAALYVTSLGKAAGKTVVGAGVGRHLLSKKKRVAFLKPLLAEGLAGGGADSDAVFMKQVLSLAEPVEALCPLIDGTAAGIKKAYARVAEGKDAVIIEGSGPAYFKVAEALGARVIVVEGYAEGLSPAGLVSAGKEWGKRLLGVALNKVPRRRLERVSGEAAGWGVDVLGVLPEDRALFTLTVAELAEHIHGEIVGSVEKSDQLVENIMLGAMTVDPGPQYFGRKSNKAVIIRGERPDMQLAALETPTACLVITGDTAPIPPVLYNAESKKVPVILTRDDVVTTVLNIENALGRARFNQVSKLSRLAQIMEQHFNLKAVDKGLGLSK